MSTTKPLMKRMGLGAAAGIVSTFFMQAMMKTSGKAMPDAKPPIGMDPGDFMVRRARALLPERAQYGMPDNVHQAAAKSLHLGYGMTAGVLYALARPRPRRRALEGALLGLGVWAAGYLGWLPATRLMQPLREQTPKQIAVPLVQHTLFGVAVAALFDAMLRARIPGTRRHSHAA
jgi:hypothetical protein